MKKDFSTILAKRYATAFLDLYGTHFTRETIARIETLGDLLHNNARTLFFFKLSLIPDEKKRAFVLDLFNKEQIPYILSKLIDLLIAHKRLSLLDLVLQQMAILYKERNNIIEVRVKTSHAVSSAQREQIEQFCAHQIPQKKLEYTYEQDPRLEIGIALQSPTYRWERSLRKLLQQIRHSSPA